MAPGQKQDYWTGEILRKWQGVTIGYCTSMYNHANSVSLHNYYVTCEQFVLSNSASGATCLVTFLLNIYSLFI
jgi:hypothetical protein